jgi:phosphatidate cytidylyltransferase
VRPGNHGATSIRLLTAGVLIPLTLALIWVPALDVGFVIFVTVLAVAGGLEYANFLKAKGLSPHAHWIAAGCGLIIAASWWGPTWVDTVFVAAITALAFRHLTCGPHTLGDVVAALFGLLYMGWLPAHFVLIHNFPVNGPGLLTFLIATVVLADTGAYFAGRTFGKHKMAPVVSPNKTWEGVAGGIVASLIGTAVMVWMSDSLAWFDLPGHPLWIYLVLTVMVVVASIVGDLLESLMKRDAGVKDSGSIFPGHGGVLDRCDGMLLAGPVLYYCLAAANG